MSGMRKFKWSLRMIQKTLKEISKDLWDYYFTPYPILLIIGAIRRLRRRLKLIWVPRGQGRPQISQEVVDLILEMKRDNPGWGNLRISQEIALLGISISDESVRIILRDNGFIPPRTRFTPITWSAFYAHHKHLWQIDLTSVFDCQGLQIFIFAAIDFESRTLVSINATLNPTREWIIQQICNASVLGFELPTAVIADNDGVYGKWLERDLKKFFEIVVFRTPYRQPWKNGRIERYFRSIKGDIFHRVDVADVCHARELCVLYQEYYTHQSKNGLPPESCHRDRSVDDTFIMSSIRKIKVADGLITRYEIAA